ncbi:hypothetical protein AB833_02415 [Chromatiales bacterium (ex Bugula neritina AB1)]|nr:hypothetical protein AB833_02415 [Chromatiales bacterium (ex Bugula neritina AB1)]
MNRGSTILSLCSVNFSTPDRRSLGCNVNIDLEAGQFLLLTGPNGAGKSTLIEIILGMRPLDSGFVHLQVPEPAISYLPQMQDTQTHMPFSLRDVLQVSVDRTVDDDEITGFNLLTSEHLDLGWNNASGGEKRRTLLTSIFLQEPELIVLDEPFNHLDTDSRQIMASSLGSYVKRLNKCVILSTHEGFESDPLLGELTIKHIAL